MSRHPNDYGPLFEGEPLGSSGEAVVRAIGEKRRLDLSGVTEGAAALLLCRAAAEHDRPALVLTADPAAARRTAANLRFFLGERPGANDPPGRVLLFPAKETTPFVDVVADRRPVMNRLSVLFHLAHALPFHFLVAPVSALVRRVPPREAVTRRSAAIETGAQLDREAFLRLLTECGYLRVPLVEDPGSFAVRGFLIDVFTPHQGQPARIELDDERVVSVKRFHPDDQRTRETVPRLSIHPVRDALTGPEELERARRRIGQLCDEINLPSSRRASLIQDIQSGRLFFGMERFLPAFYAEPADLFDYLPEDTRVVAIDPTAIIKAVAGETARAARDREARVAEKDLVFPLSAHYLSEQQLADRLTTGPLVAIHRLAVGGRDPDDPAGPLAELETPESDTAMRVHALDHRELTAELDGRRSTRGGAEPLAPLAARTRAWLDEGLRVVFTAHTTTQGERLHTLLKSHRLSLSVAAEPLALAELTRLPAGTAHVVTGELADGFVLPGEALCCVTEREIFGERRQQTQRRPAKRLDKAARLDDLQELAIGDYVVHQQHGVGRYLGLQRQHLPLSKYERMQGLKPIAIEVLAVEYAGGDRLFVPVSRLNQVGKHTSADGGKPRLDRLGGQTFARTKSRVREAVQRLADDLLSLYASRASRSRPALPPLDRAYTEFEATFPFEETPDQSRAIDDVMADLGNDRPMDRLVCGDVGFGKTEIALRAAFRAAMNGRQVALLCPTTVLAQQHLLTFRQRLRPYPLRVEVLSRFVPKKAQTPILADLKEGTADIVIGTHRLLSRDVHFKNLGLLVVDEEQRFGVAHKERIKRLKTGVDVLTLSATPIPRTLQMAVTGLRELSLITTAPVDRRAIRTLVTRWDDHVVREAVLHELSRGGQVFLVHNRIETLDRRAAQLSRLVPEARVAVAHGQMREAALERIMTDFVDGRSDVLCCTAIIENGLDIPRANTILIDRADRFGLAQLYQLRGRVGRASERAFCYLVAPPPSRMTDEARTRIDALERFSHLGSGFQLASLDMEMRGAGDLLGAEQSGNLAAVGLDLFVRMLEQAIAELRGETVTAAIDPELTVDIEQYLPETYIDDVGIRLSLYKRFASAETENAVAELASEMEDRFGRPPPEAGRFVRVISLKPALRDLRVLGCEATSERVTLHFDASAPLDPEKITALVAGSDRFRLTPDMKLIRTFDYSDEMDAVDRVRAALLELAQL